jgi:hypothetical protein
MDKELASALSELVKEVVGQLPAVRAVILFGSHAKGRAAPHSDVDLLVIRDAAVEDGFDVAHIPFNGLTVEVTFASTSVLRADAERGAPFVLAVLRHGIGLYDDGCVEELRQRAAPRPGEAFIREQVARAKARLAQRDLRAAATYALNAKRLLANNVDLSCHLEALSPPGDFAFGDVEVWIREAEEGLASCPFVRAGRPSTRP